MNSNINNLIYIDTLEAYTLIQNDFDNVTDILITDNPLLANNSIIEKNIFDITKLLSQEKHIEIGGLALGLCNDIENIIVTDSSYSTLSWCLMDNVPIVFLKSRICSRLISKEVEEYFKESFLVIDNDELYWEYKLINLLNLPKTSLYSLWNAKKTKRKFLVEKYLCGPTGNSGLRAANFIDKYIRNYNDKI